MKKHPSGRPIRKPQRRDYSMAVTPYIGFRCPRLNNPRVETHAVGFIDHRNSYDEYTPDEAKRRK